MEHDNKNIEEQQPLSRHEQWELREAMSREHTTCPDIDEQWHVVSERLGLADEQDLDTAGAVPMLRRPWVRWTVGIAATLALIVGYSYWTGQSTPVAHVDASAFAVNVPEEIDEVTVSTADGRNQPASGKQLKLDRPSDAPVQLMAISTPRGKD